MCDGHFTRMGIVIVFVFVFCRSVFVFPSSSENANTGAFAGWPTRLHISENYYLRGTLASVCSPNTRNKAINGASGLGNL